MNEASVGSAFMHLCRERMPGAVVMKHQDSGFVGMPDCSITWKGHTIWLEFKLFVPGKTWDGELDIKQLAMKSPVQYATCRRLAENGHCYYLVWVKKGARLELWNPYTEALYAREVSNPNMAHYISGMFANLEACYQRT